MNIVCSAPVPGARRWRHERPARHATHLWARDAGQAAAMRSARENARYLPGVRAAAVARCRAPISTRRSNMRAMDWSSSPRRWRRCATMLQPPARARASAVALQGLRAGQRTARPRDRRRGAAAGAVGVLSGPSFAARGRRAAADRARRGQRRCGSRRASRRGASRRHPAHLRQQRSGRRRGRRRGEERDGHRHRDLRRARAGPERARRADHAGAGRDDASRRRAGRARRDLHGLSGLGDLVLTATGELSRNRQVGLRLARGRSADGDPAPSSAMSPKASYSAHRPWRHARGRLGVEMPITDVVVEVLEGRLAPSCAPALLMGRDARPE